ncbi:AAA family ATPase [uncultured Tateyamaria sp.]|uniref:AAA family ATPase n=1 Tax=uncultured Tateyamaria sp. TaxID=455651 RepID=UPI00262856CB|nr:AAA family ATPase [uncultured Tateyamaria sp.]
MSDRLRPSEVFTPRRTDVNTGMYIDRGDVQRVFFDAISSTQHLIVFGDSGSGKTWLYKQAFSEKGADFLVVDLAKADLNGLDYALASALPQPRWKTIKRTSGGNANWKILDFGFGGSIKQEEEPVEVDAFDAIIEYVKQSGRNTFLVFDNLEQVSRNQDILKQILSLVIQLDNASSGGDVLRFLFVGVVSDMAEVVAAHDFAGTIGNRLYELPEVQRLNPEETAQLLERGFCEKLKIDLDRDYDYFKDIAFLTDRNAQQLHSLSYEIACEARDAGYKLNKEVFDRGVQRWESSSLKLYSAQVQRRMNKRDTRIQRRNQVLFAMAISDKTEFTTSDVEAKVRELFPGDAEGKQQLGIDQIVKQLATGTDNILAPVADGTFYRFAHPKYRPAIRMRLEHLKKKSGKQRIDVQGRRVREIVQLITNSFSENSE